VAAVVVDMPAAAAAAVDMPVAAVADMKAAVVDTVNQ
jgi:hypothetical protein